MSLSTALWIAGAVTLLITVLIGEKIIDLDFSGLQPQNRKKAKRARLLAARATPLEVGVVAFFLPVTVGGTDMPGLQHPQAGIFAVALIDRPAVMPRNEAFQGGGVQNTLAPFSAIIAPIGKTVFW